jgi:hypothetical protein
LAAGSREVVVLVDVGASGRYADGSVQRGALTWSSPSNFNCVVPISGVSRLCFTTSQILAEFRQSSTLLVSNISTDFFFQRVNFSKSKYITKVRF